MDSKIRSSRAAALLVDDHADVLVTTSAFLEAAGFDVVRAANGDEALAHLASGKRFVLLVTDYAMPGLNGVDLVTQALERAPALKVMVITGFPDSTGFKELPEGVALLVKPFGRDSLIAQLASLFGLAIGPLQTVGSAREDDIAATQRDIAATQRDTEARQRDIKASHRDIKASHRDLEARQRDFEARQRDLAAYERNKEPNSRDGDGRKREDEGRRREDEGRQREDEGRQREDEGRQREIALEEAARRAEEVRR